MRRLVLPKTLSVALLSGAMAACDGASPRPDASAADARPADARPEDARADAGGLDAGPTDRGPGPLFCIPDRDYDAGRPLDASCTTTAWDPSDCPEGCRAVG